MVATGRTQVVTDEVELGAGYLVDVGVVGRRPLRSTKSVEIAVTVLDASEQRPVGGIRGVGSEAQPGVALRPTDQLVQFGEAA